MESKTPTIIDLNAELAKLTMFRGLTPQTKRAERRGSGTQLGPYRDGILIAGKSAGTSHWETHPEDELVHVLDGTKTLEIVCDDGAAEVLRASRRNARRRSAGCVAPLLLCGGRDDLERDASRRSH